VVISMAGWMNHQQQQAIDYLREENRVLREQFGGRRLRFTDDQRRRLAVKASYFPAQKSSFWKCRPLFREKGTEPQNRKTRRG
jgi:hypothetical protein